MKKQVVATRKPTQSAMSQAAKAPTPEEKLRFRKLIDKDEIEHLVTAALLAEKPVDSFVQAFCEQHGYVGPAAVRVYDLVVHVYTIRKAQQEEGKKPKE